MQLSDLDFVYPPELVAQEPSRPSRVACIQGDAAPCELTVPALLELFQSGDTLVINDSRVIPARIFSLDQDEILFLKSNGENRWEVLFPSREFKVGDELPLPGGVIARLERKGLPQMLSVSAEIDHEYFFEHGEVALPPYIQEARGERHNRATDREWYQPAWAREPGSVASPTASLHFNSQDLEALQAKGVFIAPVTLHVGAGTFLPVRTDNLDEHRMHAENFTVPDETWARVQESKRSRRRVWVLGTTAARSLEAYARGEREHTDIFIRPPFQFQVVDALLTNFHQPRSTLLGLVAAFAGLERAKSVYAWAIENRFRLFSYGDLSAWIR